MVKEPKFMQKIHQIRAELSEMPSHEYAKYLEEVRKKYFDILGHLYTEPVIVKRE